MSESQSPPLVGAGEPELLRLDTENSTLSDDNTVYVKNKNTDEIDVARVTESGIIREKDGQGAYSPGAYEIFTTDPNMPVIITFNNHRVSFHTSECRSIRRGENSARKIIPISQAIEFYELKQCSYCSGSPILTHGELSQYAKIDFTN